MSFRNRKKPVWLALLFFLSTGGGVAVFFIWKSLPSLATPPDLRLYSAIRSAKTAFELAKESMPAENAVQKPDPFKQPEAYLKDDSKSASGRGAPGEYQAPGKTGRPSRSGSKLSSRFRKPPMKGRLKRGIRSSGGSSTSGRPVSSFKKAAGDELAIVSKDLSSAEKDSPLVGALASLKKTSEHVGDGATLSSGDEAKYHTDMAYAEAQAGQKGMSYGENLAKLDTVETDVKDLKMQASRALTAPDPGLPARDKSAEEKDPVLNKIKDAVKKAVEKGVNPAPAIAAMLPPGSSPPPSGGPPPGPLDDLDRMSASGQPPPDGFNMNTIDPMDVGDLDVNFGVDCYWDGDSEADLNEMGYYTFETSDGLYMYDDLTGQTASVFGWWDISS